jgi:hypothetical protein
MPSSRVLPIFPEFPLSCVAEPFRFLIKERIERILDRVAIEKGSLTKMIVAFYYIEIG